MGRIFRPSILRMFGESSGFLGIGWEVRTFTEWTTGFWMAHERLLYTKCIVHHRKGESVYKDQSPQAEPVKPSCAFKFWQQSRCLQLCTPFFGWLDHICVLHSLLGTGNKIELMLQKRYVLKLKVFHCFLTWLTSIEREDYPPPNKFTNVPQKKAPFQKELKNHLPTIDFQGTVHSLNLSTSV